jgi:hypothetical protein
MLFTPRGREIVDAIKMLNTAAHPDDSADILGLWHICVETILHPRTPPR